MAKRNLPLGGAIPMEAGERDRKVTIQQSAEAKGGSGRPVETWSFLQYAWMRMMGLSGKERFATAQETASATTQWEMGYCAAMDPELVDVPKKRRLVYQGRVFDITSAEQIGRRDGIELLTLATSKVPS